MSESAIRLENQSFVFIQNASDFLKSLYYNELKVWSRVEMSYNMVEQDLQSVNCT